MNCQQYVTCTIYIVYDIKLSINLVDKCSIVKMMFYGPGLRAYPETQLDYSNKAYMFGDVEFIFM